MRNLRKLMAVIVSVAIMASLLVAPAFAEQTMTDVEVCELLDVLRGTGGGLTAEYLASKPQRYQAARLFLRLQGLEDDALAFPGTANFSDVEAMPDWQFAAENKAVLAYLYANPELGFVGYTDGTFRPFNEISAMEYYKVLLTALGYEQNVDYVYGDDLLDFAASLGLSEVADVEEFTIMHLATATVEALKAVVKDGEETLLEKLVADGVIDEDLAIETGIYKEAVVALEVTDVTWGNLVEAFVTFNQKLDASTVKVDNFKAAGAKAGDVDLLSDGMTVKVTVASGKNKANGSSLDLEVTTGVKSASGVALAKAFKDSQRVFDRELPEVVGVKLTGPRTIEITFSEPVTGADASVKINKGIYGCKVDAIAGVTNVVTVTINSSKLPEKDYTISISGFKDYAGFTMLAVDETLAYAADKSPIDIVASSVVATQTYVKFSFNKEVVFPEGVDIEDYFYHTYSAYKPLSVDDSKNPTFTVYFTDTDDDTVDRPIPVGETKLVILSGGSGKKIKDLWGNELDRDITVQITVTADTEAPYIVKAPEVKSQKKIDLTFNEAIKGWDKKDNYAITDADGNKVEINTISYDIDKFVVSLQFANNLSGDYGIIIKGIVDDTINQNKMVEVSYEFTVDDMTPPDEEGDFEAYAVDNGEADEKDIIYVHYPEKMATEGTYSVLNTDNYRIKGDKLPDKTTIDPFGTTGTIVKITLPDASVYDVVGLELTIGRVADLAGNKTAKLTNVATIQIEEAPKVEAIEQTSKNQLKVTFNKILTSLLDDAFVIKVGNKDPLEEGDGVVVESFDYDYKKGKTIAILTLTEVAVDELFVESGEVYGTNSGYLFTQYAVLSLVGEHVVSETGKPAVNDADLNDTVKDKWAPTMKSVTTDVYGDEIVIAFSEDLDDALESWYAQDLVVKDKDGKVKKAGVDYTTEVDGKTIVIKLAAGLTATKDWKVSTKDTVTYICDASAQKNLIVKFGETKVKVQ